MLDGSAHMLVAEAKRRHPTFEPFAFRNLRIVSLWQCLYLQVSIENELKGLGTAVDKANKELLKVEPLHEERKQKEEETNKG